MYKARNIDKIKDVMRRQVLRKVRGTIASLFLMVFGFYMFTGPWHNVLQVLGFLMFIAGTPASFIYLVVILPNRFHGGFSKAERFNWMLDRLCRHLENYVDTHGRDSGYSTRWSLYTIADLFPEWSWKPSDGRPFVFNDLFQQLYLDFSHSLHRLFSRLNYFLVKKLEVPRQVWVNLNGLRASLDEFHAAPSRKQMECVKNAEDLLLSSEKTGVDEQMAFGIRMETLERLRRRIVRSPYATVLIADVVTTIGYFSSVPSFFPDLSSEQLLMFWLLLLAIVSPTVATISARRSS